ncbi:MAG: hypothetical protein MUP71_11160 [Candidatus Aminicenantes bacterium]|nr:hypothetical protein [Candidatus Aminicenantes bacterium]
MGKLIFRFIFILSILLNLSMAVHFFKDNFKTNKAEFALNLTKQQKEKMAEIHLVSHKKNEQIKIQIKRCQEKMITDLKAVEVDKDKIFAHLRDISALQEKIQQNTIEEILALKKFLHHHQCECLIDGLQAKLAAATKICSKECCHPEKKTARENTDG